MTVSGVGRFLPRLAASPLLRASGIYVTSNVLNRAIPFLLLPVLTRYLTPSDLGRVAMFTMAVNLALPLVGLSADAAISRQYFERTRIDFPKYVGTCLYILAATLILVAAGLFVARRPVAAVTALPTSWLWAVVVVALGRFIIQVALVRWQVEQRPLPYGAFLFSLTALIFAMSVHLVVNAGRGWQGRVLGEVVGIGAFAVAGLIVLVRNGWIRPGVDRAYLTHALKFGGGLVPHLYGGVLIMGATDRLFVTNLVGVDATGLYAVAAQLAMVIGILEHSFNQAWAPWLYGRLTSNRPEDHVLIKRLTRLYNVGILVLAAGLTLVAPWFLSFFVGPQFAAASTFVGWLALAGAFGGMYKMVVNQIFFANKPHLLASITIAIGTVNVGLTWALIRSNGAVGAAQAVAVSQLLSYVLTAWLSGHLMARLRATAGA